MVAVIRRAELAGEPVLVQTGVATPSAPASTAAASPAASAPMRPPAASPPRAEAPDPAAIEADLRRRLAAEREQVLQQAVQDGVTEGRELGRAEWADRVAQLDALLGAAHEQFAAGVAGSEDLLVELAFEAVVKIIGHAAPTREGVQGIVREALKGLREREQLVIRLAPADVETIRSLRAEMTRLAGSKGLEIVADERIELGGCLIETAGGGLDARLETQMRRLHDLLLAARASEGGP